MYRYKILYRDRYGEWHIEHYKTREEAERDKKIYIEQCTERYVILKEVTDED